MTITEDYVSIEIAKLLREKGFDTKCTTVYTITECVFKNRSNRGGIAFKANKFFDMQLGGYKASGKSVYAPTLQMAMKWMRESKGIAIVPILSSVLDNEKFLWDIEIIVAKTNETYHQGWVYESYERACEAAIKYCLTNLI
jgi:hypothetical protein